MQGKIREILVVYETANGKRSKAAEAIRGEIQKCLSQLSSKERQLLPEEIRAIDYFGAAAEDLRKFGRGYLEDGERRYNEFNSVKLRAAVAIYLSHPLTQQKYAIRVSSKELGLEKQDAQIAMILAQAFNPGNIYSSSFISNLVDAKYKGETFNYRSLAITELNILSKVNELIFNATMTESRSPLLDNRARSKQPSHHENSSDVVYEGWMIISERQGLFFYANNVGTGEIEYFVLIGMEQIENEKMPCALTFYQASASPVPERLPFVDNKSTRGDFEQGSDISISDNLLKLLRE